MTGLIITVGTLMAAGLIISVVCDIRRIRAIEEYYAYRRDLERLQYELKIGMVERT